MDINQGNSLELCGDKTSDLKLDMESCISR